AAAAAGSRSPPPSAAGRSPGHSGAPAGRGGPWPATIHGGRGRPGAPPARPPNPPPPGAASRRGRGPPGPRAARGPAPARRPGAGLGTGQAVQRERGRVRQRRLRLALVEEPLRRDVHRQLLGPGHRETPAAEGHVPGEEPAQLGRVERLLALLLAPVRLVDG